MHNSDTVTGHEFLSKLKSRSDKKTVSFDKLYNQLDKKARARGIPMNGQFELTPLCNFDCRMCYSHLTKDQMLGDPLLSVEQWKQIIDEAYAVGLMRVTLTGGECLTYPGFKELYLYIHSLGCETRVLTNGSLLDDGWISFFREHLPSLIQVSLYGSDDDSYERVTGHRCFSVVSANIRKALDAKLPVSLAITPSRYMGKGILDTIRTAHSFGTSYYIPTFLVDPKEETGRSGQDHELDFDTYAEAYKLKNTLEGKENLSIDAELLPPPGGPHHKCELTGMKCGGGMSCFDIDWNGAMYICNYSRSVVCHPLTEGFLPSWNKLHQIAAGWSRIPECVDCPYEPFCTECEIRKAKFGKNGQQTPGLLCDFTRCLVQNGVYAVQDHI
ncbi:MAG: radical SAM protein [Clostridiales bacterium]|nr:radical SAM protein [Clostridiales bacterium]